MVPSLIEELFKNCAMASFKQISGVVNEAIGNSWIETVLKVEAEHPDELTTVNLTVSIVMLSYTTDRVLLCNKLSFLPLP